MHLPVTIRYSHATFIEVIRVDVKLKQYSPKHSDIWALGVILMNMLTGRSPWRAAVSSEACYNGFMHDPLYLRAMLPLSRPTVSLIGRILKLNPLARLAIKDIKDAIMNIETFFMREDEVQRASAHVREIVARTLPKARLNDQPIANPSPAPKVSTNGADAPAHIHASSPHAGQGIVRSPTPGPGVTAGISLHSPIPGATRPPTPRFAQPPTPGPAGSPTFVNPADSDDEYIYDSPDPDSPLVYIPPTRRAAPTRAPLPGRTHPPRAPPADSGSGSSLNAMHPP